MFLVFCIVTENWWNGMCNRQPASKHGTYTEGILVDQNNNIKCINNYIICVVLMAVGKKVERLHHISDSDK